MKPEKHVFIFVCTKCKRKHYQLTNSLPPFVMREHSARYFCNGGRFVPKGSELAERGERYVHR